MSTKTKIICTMGPAVSTYEQILALIDAGMNVARLNFSHSTQEEHLKTIQLLKKARAERKISLAIMLDTKGPEIRVGNLKGGSLSLEAGQQVLLVGDRIEGDSNIIPITPAAVLESIEEGMSILFDDGYILSKVIKKEKKGVTIEIQNGGILKTHKGINIPLAYINLPAMTEQDIQDITFGCLQDVDVIAASFIRSADHILEIKNLLKKQSKSHILVIAKIENSLGVKNFDAILDVADGIMVARGDLGVELPLEQVPQLQKMMIRKCYQKGKPSITATQMLETMIYNPRPTRAEVSDVANAIYDSTTCVMLSAETASGKYPIQAVQMMKNIIQETEKEFSYRDFFAHSITIDYHDIASSVALASVKTAYSLQAKAIFAFTTSGSTTRLISQFRPEMPIFGLTANERTYQQLSLYWGVIPIDPLQSKNIYDDFTKTSSFAIDYPFLKRGDCVVVTAGSSFGVPGSTNMMMVTKVSSKI
jgi:pyruvate kinase